MKISKAELDRRMKPTLDFLEKAEVFRMSHSDCKTWEDLSQDDLEILNCFVHDAMDLPWPRNRENPLVKRLNSFFDWNASLGGYDN
jgi:hypothetical protein